MHVASASASEVSNGMDEVDVAATAALHEASSAATI